MSAADPLQDNAVVKKKEVGLNPGSKLRGEFWSLYLKAPGERPNMSQQFQGVSSLKSSCPLLSTSKLAVAALVSILSSVNLLREHGR
jgi:hypothetical protein